MTKPNRECGFVNVREYKYPRDTGVIWSGIQASLMIMERLYSRVYIYWRVIQFPSPSSLFRPILLSRPCLQWVMETCIPFQNWRRLTKIIFQNFNKSLLYLSYFFTKIEKIIVVIVMLSGVATLNKSKKVKIKDVAFFSYIMGNFIEIISSYEQKMGFVARGSLNRLRRQVQRS